MNAGELRQRMQRTIPNPFLRTLELEDSLSLNLTPAQEVALKIKGDSLQVRTDSAIAKIAEVLGSVGANPDPQTTMFRMRDIVQAGRRMAEQAAKDLEAILTAEQWTKLPPNVKNPLMPGRGQPGEGGLRMEMRPPPEYRALLRRQGPNPQIPECHYTHRTSPHSPRSSRSRWPAPHWPLSTRATTARTRVAASAG